MEKLGFYVLSNGDGTYITQSGGRYVPIRSFNQALKITDLTKAMRILNSSISKSIRSHFIPEFHGTEETVQKDSEAKQREICFRAIDHGELAEWQEKIEQLVELFGNTENRYSELSTKLSDVDKEITDIEHYIEFGKFNCYQGWLCFKMLQNLLQQRRQYKNEMQVITRMKESKISGSSIKALFEGVKEIQNKLYTPRKFPELFKGVGK